MYTSKMLHDQRFNGAGYIMDTSYGLANQGLESPPDGGVSVMNAVDLLRLLIIGDVGGVYAAAALGFVAQGITELVIAGTSTWTTKRCKRSTRTSCSPEPSWQKRMR
jgi:hypothetical protein